ncbi:TPA: hypothetical protein U2B88_000305 [Streptococcus suis]|nr:hypothetical protein [Streptococcus suis]
MGSTDITEILITLFWYVLIYGSLILIAYPTEEGGNKTLLGMKPNYLLQKILELIAFPIAIGVLVNVLS